MTAPTVADVEAALRALAAPDQFALIAKRVPSDQVIGVRMKLVFDLANAHRDVDLDLVRDLLRSRWYELRMVGVSILDAKARRIRTDDPGRTAVREVRRADPDAATLYEAAHPLSSTARRAAGVGRR